MSELRTLAEEADRIHAEYRRHFAGRSRFTRELSRLDALLSQTNDLLARAEAHDEARDTLAPTLRQRIELYTREREAIAELQAGGPDEEVAWRTSTLAGLSRQRYLRNYAGKSRSTRDLGLLEELAGDIRRWRDELRTAAASHDPEWHKGDLAEMDRLLRLFEGEVEQIRRTRQELAPVDHARALATEANLQFRSWRTHFQGRPRNSRRPGLLRRMLASVERIHADMKGLQSRGVDADFHRGNIDTVGRRIPTWQQELAAIERARAPLDADQLAGLLGEDANTWFSRYREQLAGKQRSSVDLEGLGEICEGLHEVARNMDEQHRTWGRDLNRRNLQVVLDNLKSYEREYERVKDVQQPKA